MKRLICILLFVACFFVSSPALGEKEHDFRNSDWRMSKEDVIKAEGDVAWNETYDIYTSIIGTMNCNVVFAYDEENTLQSGVIEFTDIHTNTFLYINDYDNISSALTTKYGDPAENYEVWLNDLFKDNRNDWGLAVASGQLMLAKIWKTDTTSINLVMTGDNYVITFGILYNDITDPFTVDMNGL